MLEKLTAAQEAKLPEYRDKWLAIGLSCEPLDFEKAKAAVALAYKAAKLPPPATWRPTRWRNRFQDPSRAAIPNAATMDQPTATVIVTSRFSLGPPDRNGRTSVA